MGAYFRVYHRRSKEPLATYDERQIVDFCMSNKDTITNYSFAVMGSKELMEWEAFAVKYSHLFVRRARKREQEERQSIERAAMQEEIKEKRKKPIRFLLAVAAAVSVVLVVALVFRAVFYRAENKQSDSRTVVTVPGQAETLATIPPKPSLPALAKRDPRPSDDTFVGNPPNDQVLAAVWKKSKKKLGAILTPPEIKEEMDKYLPGLHRCFTERAQAGDRGLKGTINIKIRVAGDGTVLDVLFTDEKYKATFFADCLAEEIKAQKFRPFQSKEQVFSYYFDL